MKTYFKLLLISFTTGSLFGWKMAKDQQRLEQEAQSRAFANDPEVQDIMAESRRMHNVDRWLRDLDEEES